MFENFLLGNLRKSTSSQLSLERCRCVRIFCSSGGNNMGFVSSSLVNHLQPQRFLLVLLFIFLSSHLAHGWVEPLTYKSCPFEGRENITFRNYCEIYTRCEDGRSTLETCEDGLYFNPWKKQCDFPKNVKGCDPLDNFAPTTARPSKQLVAKIQQNFECEPLDIIVKRRGKRRCKVQVICANGISFVLKRCMQTISFKV